MSEFTTLIVTKPKWFRIVPTKTGFGKREPYVIGFDSEAYRGNPITLQFSTPDETFLMPTNAKDALSDFLEVLEPIAKLHGRKRQIIVIGWNLRYEYTQLFRGIDPEAWQSSHFQLHFHDTGTCEGKPNDDWDVLIDAMNDKRYAFTVSFTGHVDNRRGTRRDRYPIKVVDGMAFFNTGLDKAAGIVGIEGKDDKPAHLGNIPLSKAMKDQAFIDYSLKDARITRMIGEKIVEYHRHYDIKMTISAPMYAAHVFRRRFLDGEIPLCENDLEDAGLKSYHGGKNGYYLDRPMGYELAYDYDVNAAYTSAMAALPDPVESVWDGDVHHYEPGVHGIWFVRARVESCIYRAFQEVNGRWHTWKDDGDLAFWITSYELDEALRLGEVRDIYECTGFVMRGESGTGSIRRFCDEMYTLKRFATTPEERQMAKLCLNSLYGKLIQKVPATSDSVFPMFDVTDNPDGTFTIHNSAMVPGGYKAGGLYHPALASLVTGNVRARIHAYEHKYKSLMTSTDGFLSLVAPDPADLSDEFGTLKVKTGSLSIWRERLYHFEPTVGDPVYALHGFRGKLKDLLRIPLEPGIYKYKGIQMVGLRDSLHLHDGRRYRPGQFAELPYEVDLHNVNERSPIR